MFKHPTKYKVKVKAESIKKDLQKVIVQFHRFPGTNSTVAHASIDGFELAVASSPCVDPRNFDNAIGEYWSQEKVMKLAEEKLWEMHGMGLLTHLKEMVDEVEFYEKYKNVYHFDWIKEPPTYKAADIKPCMKIRSDLSFDIIDDNKVVKVKAPEGTFFYDRGTLVEIKDRRVGMAPDFNIHDYVHDYLSN